MTSPVGVRRSEDGELVGFVEPHGDLFVPTTVFGYPLAEPCDESDAEQTVRERGMQVLADRWSLKLDGRDEPIAVRIVEVTQTSVTVQNVDYGYEGNTSERFAVAAPLDGSLRLA